MNSNISEATRLAREGRLAEATALLQRTLNGGHTPAHASMGPSRLWKPLTGQDTTGPLGADPAPSVKAPASDTRPPQSSIRAFRSMPDGRPFVSPFISPVDLRVPGLEGLLGRGSGLKSNKVDVAGPGQWIAGTYTCAAGTRDYQLYIPSGYHGQAVPLVVMLHGCTQNPKDFAAGTGMNAVAEAEGFLVAYPAQAPTANISKCWNWFEAAHQEREQGEPALIAGITCQVMDQYNIEPGRVYVAGLSAGGAMAAIMGAQYPDLYAAIGVHSGLAPGCAHDLPSALQAMKQGGSRRQARTFRPAPLILFHGDGDATVHSRNADHLVQQWTAAQTPGAAIPSVTVEQGQAPGGRTYTRQIYHDSHGQPIVEQWTIHGAGHAWSGGSNNGSYTDPAGPDASGELTRFFQEHPRATPTPPVS